MSVDSITVAVEAARDAARRLMEEPEEPLTHEPTGPWECHAAVEELAAAFQAAGKTFKQMVDNSRSGAESLSSDSLQGLSEIVQNADDTGATAVSFALARNVLEVRHNGRPVDLRDLRAMSVPWLTTKIDDPTATGRFGVGLSTLHAVAQTFEIHSGQYHVCVGDPFLTNLTAEPSETDYSPETVLRVVFEEGLVPEADFLRWWQSWDDAALIFLRNVRKVTFSTSTTSRTLRLRTQPRARIEWDPMGDGSLRPVDFSVARAPDGRRWLLATCDAVSPHGVSRARKKKGATTPLGVALPLHKRASAEGRVYAGLPVTILPGISVLMNAQFDPVTGRQGFLASAWNYALAELVDDLWDQTIRFLFESNPKKAWRCVPLPNPHSNPPDASEDFEEGDTTASLVAHLRSRLHQRANRMASTLSLEVNGDLTPLTRLAVENADLTELLDDGEIVALAGAEHRLPDEARDRRAHWREVLEHWRTNVPEIPGEVTIHDALRLLDQPQRAVRDVIRLTAVALNADLGQQLQHLACIIDYANEAHQPPGASSPIVLTPSRAGLAADLALAIPLHPDYLADEPSAVAVRGWLSTSGLLIDTDSDLPTLKRLAAAGTVGQRVEEPLDDERLKRLRIALEGLDNVDLNRLGSGIGRAIYVEGFEFEPSGHVSTRPVRPCDAYLPKRIDTLKDGFFTAAATTPGLVWVANRYVDVLKSDLPRGAGLGAQKFLRSLGVATTPRVTKHADLQAKYASPKEGLPRNNENSPTERVRALTDLDANYTLEDWDSPDLTRVLTDIGADKNARRRRERANAIVETLGRAWRDLSDHAEVDAAWANYGWNVRGPVRAFWLWQAASIAWLDNEDGVPTPPGRLRRKSAANVAVFGEAPEAFLHKDITLHRPEVLHNLGISQEPSTNDLLQRLRGLRENPTETTYAECATVYVALASRVSEDSIGRTPRQLREQLALRGGLIRTRTDWVPPTSLLRDPAVFGHRRHFTPSIPGAESLWRFLQIPPPRIEDCLGVLSEIAKTRRPIAPDDESIALQTFRLLDTLLATRGTGTAPRRSTLSNRVKNRLASLPLWTSQGWTNKRPIYVVQDPQLVDGIGDALPIWKPGADPAQFRGLFGLLRLTPIDNSHVTVNNSDKAYLDDDATDRFHRALEHFKADLARNAAQVEQSLTVPWETLQSMQVWVHPVLEATVDATGRKPITVGIHAKIDPTQGTLFIRDEDELDRVDGVGRALATLFTADERNLAYTWLAAIQSEREGQRVRALELATERKAREARDAQEQMDRLRALQTEVTERASSGTKNKHDSKRPAKLAGLPPAQTGRTAAPTPPKPRVLVDIDSLVVTDASGVIVNEHLHTTDHPRRAAPEQNGTRSESFSDGTASPPKEFSEPNREKTPPKQSSTYRAYSDEAKERLGLKVASRVLAGEAEALIDIRNQRNVGADAIDDLGKFYELKVFANDEGDTITLEPSQIARAMSEPKFFLVIVSNLEGKHARPRVRVIVDPLRQLSMAKESKVKFSGLQEARGLVFNLKNHNDQK